MLLLALLAGGAQAPAHDGQTTQIKVWFSNSRLNPEPSDCKAVYMVERQVPSTVAVATASLKALFAGPTPAEAAMGYHSAFSARSAGLLQSIRIRRGSAYVDLHDLRAELSVASSSCGTAEIQAQISQTLRQFPTVQRMSLAIEGDPQRLHDWLNQACAPALGACTAEAFRRGP